MHLSMQSHTSQAKEGIYAIDATKESPLRHLLFEKILQNPTCEALNSGKTNPQEGGE